MGWLTGNLISNLEEWFMETLASATSGMLGVVYEIVFTQMNISMELLSEHHTDFMGGAPFTAISNIVGDVIMPIGMALFAFIITYELILLLMQKNTFADVEVTVIIVWMFKGAIGSVLLLNSQTIIDAIFEMGIILTTGAAAVNFDIPAFDYYDMVESLLELGFGTLVMLLVVTVLVFLVMSLLLIAVFLIVVGRAIEILISIVLAPIPMATFANTQFSNLGHNYLKNLAGLALQGVLLIACFAIYVGMLGNVFQEIMDADAPVMAMLQMLGYTFVLVMAMLKTGTIAKSAVGAH